MKKQVFPEFQEFLITNKFTQDQNAPYYAYWVSKFLEFSANNAGLPFELRLLKFLELLCSAETDSWKIEQAEFAIKLYIEKFSKDNNVSKHSVDGLDCPESIEDFIINKTKETIRLKHYSYSTERTYLEWIKRFLIYLKNIRAKVSMQSLNSDNLRDYLTYLAVRQRVSSSTQNQAFNALLFLLRDVFQMKVEGLDKTVRAKRGVKLPVVLTVEEVQKLFDNIDNSNKIIIQLIYGSGLRIMEAVCLRVKDVDFDNNLITIRAGKGDKDRVTMLSSYLSNSLQEHIGKVKKIHEQDLSAGRGEVYLPDALSRKYPNAAKEWGWQYFFPAKTLSVDPRSSKVRRHHIHPTSIQKSVKKAVKKAGLVKNATVHTLRHSFATHLLMNGVNIREIQELLGHKNVETTMIYTHVLRGMTNAPKSPLDNIYENRDSKSAEGKENRN